MRLRRVLDILFMRNSSGYFERKSLTRRARPATWISPTPGTFSRRSGRRGFPTPSCTNGRRRSCDFSSGILPMRALNLQSPKWPARTSPTMAGSIFRLSFSRPIRARSSRPRTARTSRATPALHATVSSRSWKRGVAKDDERVLAARAWLQDHPRLDYPEGIPEDDPEAFGEAIYFYHLAARAEAYEALDWGIIY